ncbi:MAG: diacylglycerol kinase family lipid kinase [Bacteroidales bacterium]|nr:diacylglycerol kinase family lipid kinase [Bacteroidales bacterium]
MAERIKPMIAKKKLIVIVNPVSGVRHHRLSRLRANIFSMLDLNVFIPEIVITNKAGHAREITAEGLRAGVKYFLAAGGDGTVNEVASVLSGTDAVMGILPSGSGNGLAHHLGIPVSMDEALKLFNRQHISRIDTCQVNNRFFVSIAGIGFDARVARQFAQNRRRGFITYAQLVFREYFNYRPKKYLLFFDGREIRTRAFFISFANSGQFGYNTMIAPEASITDGLIDVCIVQKPPLSAFPGIFRLVLKHRINRSRYLTTYQAARIYVKRNKGKTVNIDGEAVRMGKELNIQLIPANLNVVVP